MMVAIGFSTLALGFSVGLDWLGFSIVAWFIVFEKGVDFFFELVAFLEVEGAGLVDLYGFIDGHGVSFSLS
jgi:hypothetical protein